MKDISILFGLCIAFVIKKETIRMELGNQSKFVKHGAVMENCCGEMESKGREQTHQFVMRFLKGLFLQVTLNVN